MIQFIAGLIIGLIAGWNLLPQPAWVKRLYDRVASWVRDRIGWQGPEI